MYCTPADVEDLSKLFEGEPEPFFAKMIEKATGDIDSYLTRRYKMPITGDTPKVVTGVCADLAASYILDKHTSERYKDQTQYAEVLYKRAMSAMERIMEYGELDSLVPLSGGKDSSSYRPAMRSTTAGRSAMEDVLGRGW